MDSTIGYKLFIWIQTLYSDFLMFGKTALKCFSSNVWEKRAVWRRTWDLNWVMCSSLNPIWTKLPEIKKKQKTKTKKKKSPDLPYTKRREYGHTQARITYTYNIYICANKIHSSSHRELYAQLKKDTVWSHRARSQFPHMSSNTNTQPWEQTCQPTKKKILSQRESKAFTERERQQECEKGSILSR